MQDLSYFEKPKNDNERLLNHQYEIKKGNKEFFNPMYELGCTIALKMINKEAHKNYFVRNLSYSEKQEKAHNCITYIIEQYLKRKDFCIQKSFVGYIYLRVVYELYYRNKETSLLTFYDNKKIHKLIIEKQRKEMNL